MKFSKLIKQGITITLLFSSFTIINGSMVPLVHASTNNSGTTIEIEGTPLVLTFNPSEYIFKKDTSKFEVNAAQSTKPNGNDYVLDLVREFYKEDIKEIEANGFDVEIFFDNHAEYKVSMGATTPDYLYFHLITMPIIYTEFNRIDYTNYSFGEVILHAPKGMKNTDQNMFELLNDFVKTDEIKQLEIDLGATIGGYKDSDDGYMTVALGYNANGVVQGGTIGRVKVLFEGDEGYIAPSIEQADNNKEEDKKEKDNSLVDLKDVIIELPAINKIDKEKELKVEDTDKKMSVIIPKGAIDYQALVDNLKIDSLEVVVSNKEKNIITFDLIGNSAGKEIPIKEFDKRVELKFTPEAISKVSAVNNSSQVIMRKNNDNTYSPVTYTYENGTYTIKTNKTGTFELVNKKVTLTDVTSHYAQRNITDLFARGVVNGIGDNKYEPTRLITRGEFAVILTRALGLESKNATIFTDIKGKWYEKEITALNEYGVIDGDGTGKFNPDDQITREQAMTILSRLISKEEALNDLPITKPITKTYHDSQSVSLYAQKHVDLLSTLKIINGTDQGYLLPLGYLTRGDMAKITNLTLEHLELM